MYFFDNASTTRVYKECVDILDEYNLNKYYNPSALYGSAVEIKKDIEKSRMEISALIKAAKGNIIFTSSGSEADNLALFGLKKAKGSRIISSRAEHSAVFNSVNQLKNNGFEVVFAETNKDGRVNEDSLYSLVNDNTSLVSVMHVNSLTGAVNNIGQISKRVKELNNKTIFHTDAVQSYGKLPFRLDNSSVDLYSVSSHKIHAPKGCGFLYIANGVKVSPLIYGGGQEKGLRSSTENAGAICAFSYASQKFFKTDKVYIKNLLIRTAQTLQENIEDLKIITDINNCAPHILCVAFKNLKSEILLHLLEKHGIFVGTGSACNSLKGNLRFAEELKLGKEYENGILRISFSEFNNEDECTFLCDKICEEVNSLSKKLF